MSNYNPEGFVILKIERANSNTPSTHYKVFGSWESGGLFNGPRWRVNSGVVNYEVLGSFIMFYGETGSCYSCEITSEGTLAKNNKDELDIMIEYTPSDTKVEIITLETFMGEFNNEE
jgi:hypothetical protein